MKVFERRSEIVERMKVRKFDTIYNLAFEFGVSERTISNDIMELSVCGYSIVSNPGRGGGINWIGGKCNFPFTEREIVALKNAIKLVTPEDKYILENLICERTKIEFNTNYIFDILTCYKSQRALAIELGISQSHLSRVLSGKKKPSESLTNKILKLKGM